VLVGWTLSFGNSYLFSGESSNRVTNNNLYLWNGLEWSYLAGSENGAGSYGTRGVANSANYPPYRLLSYYWADNLGGLWVGGGLSGGFVNDLWKLETSSNYTYQWIWMAGTGDVNTNDNPGASGVTNSSYYPSGGFIFCGVTTDEIGRGLVFAGVGEGMYVTNLLWRWDHYINEWAFLGGGYIPAQNTPDPFLDVSFFRSGNAYYAYGGEDLYQSGTNEFIAQSWKLKITKETFPTTGTSGTTGTTSTGTTSTGTTSTGTSGTTATTGTTGTTGTSATTGTTGTTGTSATSATTGAPTTGSQKSVSSIKGYSLISLLFLLPLVI